MTPEIQEFLLYALVPPVMALGLAGFIIIQGNYQTRKLDRQIGRDAEKAGIRLVSRRD